MYLRVMSAFVGIPLVLLTILSGYPWFTMVALVVGVVGLFEFYGLSNAVGNKPFRLVGTIWVVIIILGPQVSTLPIITMFLFALIVAFALSLCINVSAGRFVNSGAKPRKFNRFLTDFLHTTTGVIYLGIPLSLLTSLRYGAEGFEWVVLIIFGVFMTDTASLFVGRLIGRNRMAPRISPYKTWEGAVGGLLLGTSFTIALALWFEVSENPLWIILFSVVLAISAQIGDLLESMLKRSTGVKDTGSVIPGHGGLLDRLDSIVFATVVVYPLIGLERLFLS